MTLRLLSRIGHFARDTRGGATAIAAAVITLMTIGGTALIVDHLWLVNQRDLLKTAADAGGVAATLELAGLPASMSDDEVDAALQPIAERYVRFNLAGNLSAGVRDKMDESLVVSLDVDRAVGTVDVEAKADMGGTLLSKWILGYAGPADGIAVHSGVGAAIGGTEIVLALDITGSMLDDLDGKRVSANDPNSRINIVKQAAVDLVDLLAARDSGAITVGLVPWSYRVRLDETTRSHWETEDWAVYPSTRTYPHPERGPGAKRYPPEVQTLPSRSRLSEECRAWAGCLDMSVDRFSMILPAATPFTMNFFTEQTTYPEDQYVSYRCQDYTKIEAESAKPRWEEPLCYDLDRVPAGQRMCGSGNIQADGPWRVQPQDDCGGPPIMPLTADLQEARDAIDALEAGGAATYSSAGVAWARRLLSPEWRPVWGDPVHPADADGSVQKVIVLLTDGEDNHYSDARAHRREGCRAAKGDGILIFTVAAMSPDNVSGRLEKDLEECSSQSDHPSGRYVFVNNATPAALGEAFAEIGRQLMSLRRIY